MKSTLIKNGMVIDWKTREVVKRDILLEGDRISRIDLHIPISMHMSVINVEEKLVSAGLIDMHVHLREPGFEEKETIETGSKAAAKGGFTTIASMPNTRPVTDSVEIVRKIKEEANRVGLVRVLPIAAITIRELGETLSNMEALYHSGVLGFSDDGVGVQSSQIMKEAMKKAATLGLPIIAHCEDNSLSDGGCVHDGVFSRHYGLKGIPNESESVQIARDILLAESTGVHYHVCHISTKESVRLVKEAKGRGQKVTAEVTPHHLLLCEEDIPGLNPMFKMNPPLRSKADREALVEGLIEGVIDIIATDHAPHTETEKKRGMVEAPFGIVGLETLFPLLYTHLVRNSILTLSGLIEKLTKKPKEIFGLPYGLLEEGSLADLTVIDLKEEKAIDPSTFLSKGKNTPFSEWKVSGWPVMTFMNGKCTWCEDHVSRRLRDESKITT